MDELDYWRLCESLNVYQAAALIIGLTPAYLHGGEMHGVYMAVSPFDAQPSTLDSGFQAAVVALKGAIIKKRINADILHEAVKFEHWTEHAYQSGWAVRQDLADYGKEDSGAHVEFNPDIDWQKTTIDVEDLRIWLKSRGFTTGFFFPDREESQAGYLDRGHPNYAPKLAAAIRAWEAVNGDPERLHRKTPKQALAKWLNEHAATYGLTKDDGTPNATGVEEAAKLANWKPEGGPGKTPGE